MTGDLLTLSTREVYTLAIITRLAEKRMRQAEAAHCLGRSERQIRRLLRALIESGGPAGQNGANLGTAERNFRHGVCIAELAEYLLDHPGDAEAGVALAGSVLDVAEGEDWRCLARARERAAAMLLCSFGSTTRFGALSKISETQS